MSEDTPFYIKVEKILESYFTTKGLAQNQIESYNEFIINGIQSVINSEPMIRSVSNGREHIILIGDAYLDEPTKIKTKDRNIKPLTPKMARIKGGDYSTNILVNITEIISEEGAEKIKRVHYRIPICKIPVMVKSCICHLSKVGKDNLPSNGECIMDPGGYFIKNGNERVIVTQKRLNYNQVLVYKLGHTKIKKYNASYRSETRSISEETNHSVEINCMISTDEKLYFTLPKIIGNIPVGIVFKALGFNEEDFPDIIGMKDNPEIRKHLLEVCVNGKYAVIKKRAKQTEENDDNKEEDKKRGDVEEMGDVPLDDNLNCNSDEEGGDTSTPIIDENVPILPVFSGSYVINTQEDALRYISNFIDPKYYSRFITTSGLTDTTRNNRKELENKKMLCVREILDLEILPHLGISSSNFLKVSFLGYILNKLLRTYIGLRNPDVKDNIANKRYESTGILLTELFRSLYKKWCIKIQAQLEKKGQDIIAAINKNIDITKNIDSCMNTGNWMVKGNNYIRTGVCQILSRKNWLDMISHLKRAVIPISREGKDTEIRQIDPSQIFFECPSETPEGKSSGIVTNLTVLIIISSRIPTRLVREAIFSSEYIRPMGNGLDTPLKDGVDSPLKDIHILPKVFLNGVLIGLSSHPINFMIEFKYWKKMGYLHKSISGIYDRNDHEIRIFSDEGRLLRPVFVVEDGKLKLDMLEKDSGGNHKIRENMSWDYLVDKNYITYIDPMEAEYSEIVMSPDEIEPFTEYCEIHPTLMFGMAANMVPFGNFCPSPRLTYVSSMIKQAKGIHALNYRERFDTVSYLLDYPQRPICGTMIGRVSGAYDMPNGVNAILAVCLYKGFNVEDSIVINKASMERGLLTSTIFKNIFVEERKLDNFTNEVIAVPTEDKKSYYNYDYLDENGIVKVGVPVEANDVIVGKILIKSKGERSMSDVSVVIKPGEEGIIDRVCVTKNLKGYRVVNIVIRNHLIPELGDKFCNDDAQKGTLGGIIPQEDMPFNPYTGMVPDIIINTHAIPSRMTLNLLLESLSSKIGLLKGEFRDATSFGQDEDFAENLIKELASIEGDYMVYKKLEEIIREKMGETVNGNGEDEDNDIPCGNGEDDETLGEEEDYKNDLEDMGFKSYGWETMYNGCTGEEVKAKIYMGSVYYHRLKHLVREKIHFRKSGCVVTLTRQPCAGRANDGGLRFGSMENDCVKSQGCSRFLTERLYDTSDPYKMRICNDCGCGTVINGECKACKSHNVPEIKMSYVTKLLITLLNSLSIKVQLKAEN